MRIAIDLNDVIRDYTRQFYKMYKKVIDPDFDIDYDDVTDYDFMKVFPFENKDAYNRFVYEDCPYEIFGRAEIMERKLASEMNLWVQNTMRNFDEEKNPDLLLVSPFEMGLTIQSTLAFLSRIGTRIREYYFPIDSKTIWDKCDILITANPRLIENKPEGKIVFKIETPYNKDVKGDYTFETFRELIADEEQTLIKLIENS